MNKKDVDYMVSVMNYYVRIKSFPFDSEMHYVMEILNEKDEALFFRFNYLEDALSFIDDVISESKSFIDIIEGYEYYQLMNNENLSLNKKFN